MNGQIQVLAGHAEAFGVFWVINTSAFMRRGTWEECGKRNRGDQVPPRLLAGVRGGTYQLAREQRREGRQRGREHVGYSKCKV